MKRTPAFGRSRGRYGFSHVAAVDLQQFFGPFKLESCGERLQWLWAAKVVRHRKWTAKLNVGLEIDPERAARDHANLEALRPAQNQRGPRGLL